MLFQLFSRMLNLVLFLGAAIGFNVETVQYNNIKFQVWDLGMSIYSSRSASSIQHHHIAFVSTSTIETVATVFL